MTRLLYIAVALSLICIGLPWTLSGTVAPFEIVEFTLGWVALAILWWRPRWACLIGSIIWMTAVTDYFVQLVLGNRSLDSNPWLVAGIGTWAVSSSAFLLYAGEVLEDARNARNSR